MLSEKWIWFGFVHSTPGFAAGCETWGLGSTSNYCRPVLLGYGTMAGNQLPHAVLPDESIGTKYSFDAVFAADHAIVSIGICRDRGVVVVDADLEIADLFAVQLIDGRVFCIRPVRIPLLSRFHR